MKREEIIKVLQEKGIQFNPAANKADLEALMTGNAGDQKPPEQTPPAPPKETKEPSGDMAQLLKMMGGIVQKLDNIDGRVSKMEGTSGVDIKKEAKSEDIDAAASSKSKLDSKLVEIVESSLGIDFGVEIEERGDQPGFLFTVLVPQRLSDVQETERPIYDKAGTGGYVKNSDGQVMMERYWPGDRRSRAIGTAQSYDAIREHCDRVRSYIVAYYQKVKKPLPEFKVK